MAVPEPTPESLPAQQDAIACIKQLLTKEGCSQTDIINACLDGVFNDLEMTKTSLFLLSKDKLILQNRMFRGIEENSPFRKYQIELAKAGLLKILLSKPQAIWINSSNFNKYQHMIPQSLLASIRSNSFMAMSLFIGSKPVGIIYADRSAVDNTVDDQRFIRFKNLISLTSKGLTLLSKK